MIVTEGFELYRCIARNRENSQVRLQRAREKFKRIHGFAGKRLKSPLSDRSKTSQHRINRNGATSPNLKDEIRLPKRKAECSQKSVAGSYEIQTEIIRIQTLSEEKKTLLPTFLLIKKTGNKESISTLVRSNCSNGNH